MKSFKFIFFFLFFIFFNLNNVYGENAKVDEISKNLRCLICQGQSVYDSQSEFALSVKTLILNKLESGSSEKDIYDFLKSKYGNWIVYEPEFNNYTLILWILPLFLFIFGGFLIARKVIINRDRNETYK
jgi:cytochrome c-type biogenesis protein CcmH|tara:strand:- start:570 stop:956 length:387 start_codon:yes stop_codon:yes gene_type:complete